MTLATEDLKDSPAEAAALANGAAAEKDTAAAGVKDELSLGEAVDAPEGGSADAALAGEKTAPRDKGSQGINPLMGAIALMLAAPQYRHLFLADLEWRLLPPLALKQFRFFVKDGKPIGLVTWALLSEEVVKRLKSEPVQRLKPEEWRAGKHFTIVDVVAPNGGGKEMRETVMKMAKKAAGDVAEVPESEETKANEDDN